MQQVRPLMALSFAAVHVVDVLPNMPELHVNSSLDFTKSMHPVKANIFFNGKYFKRIKKEKNYHCQSYFTQIET